MTGLYALDGVAPELPEDGDYWVAPGARVVGKVRLGSAVGIWYNAVLRGDNDWIEIGRGSNIQDGCVLHTDPGFPLTIGENVTVGHSAIVHGCTIGDGSLIGMGATVLNGAKVGRHCLIGAGALVTEGREIPDGSLVLGAPAKVARALSEEDIAQMSKAAEKYQWNQRRFRQGVTEI